MTGIARPCPPFTMGIDSLSPCPSVDVARRLWDRGYRYWGRYLENLTTEERDMLFSVGFGIWLIMEARIEGLSEETGVQDGQRGSRRAMALGAPPSLHLTTDSEDTKGADVPTVTAYDNACSGTVVSFGYDSMLYVGAGQPLNGHELYSLKADRYARGGSAGIPEPGCGFALIQLYPLDQTIEGQRVDVSVVQADFRGRTPVMWWPQ